MGGHREAFSSLHLHTHIVQNLVIQRVGHVKLGGGKGRGNTGDIWMDGCIEKVGEGLLARVPICVCVCDAMLPLHTSQALCELRLGVRVWEGAVGVGVAGFKIERFHGEENKSFFRGSCDLPIYTYHVTIT